VAGAASALPFRAGQGAGAKLRLHLARAARRDGPPPPLSAEERLSAAATSRAADFVERSACPADVGRSGESERNALGSAPGGDGGCKKTPKPAAGQGRGEKAFDNVVGAVFAVVALVVAVRTAAFVWRAASCGGRSQFGVGHFGDGAQCLGGRSGGGAAAGLGLGGATRAERNARAEARRERLGAERLTAARQRDVALGLVAPGAELGDGLAKRRKKFVLGVR
jgi:hypothetical protein